MHSTVGCSGAEGTERGGRSIAAAVLCSSSTLLLVHLPLCLFQQTTHTRRHATAACFFFFFFFFWLFFCFFCFAFFLLAPSSPPSSLRAPHTARPPFSFLTQTWASCTAFRDVYGAVALTIPSAVLVELCPELCFHPCAVQNPDRSRGLRRYRKRANGSKTGHLTVLN
eukprot:Rhum_TRINITY_DN14226_c13_g33::Rhum_TRINITY_DN14226_c13_g33_i1::g.75956::m.75956